MLGRRAAGLEPGESRLQPLQAPHARLRRGRHAPRVRRDEAGEGRGVRRAQHGRHVMKQRAPGAAPARPLCHSYLRPRRRSQARACDSRSAATVDVRTREAVGATDA